MPPTEFDRAKAIAELHKALGYKPLSRTWAKVEIFLGLAMVGLVLFSKRPANYADLDTMLIGLVLFTFGGYLVMAGHRSHMYQSNNELVAYLVAELHRSQTKVEPQ